jgi:hypothetical protein
MYNFTSSSYDLTLGSASLKLANLNYLVTRMFITNYVLLMQTETGGLLLHYNLATGSIQYNDPYVTSYPVQQFLYLSGAYYILYSTGLISISFNTNTAQFIGSSLMLTLPKNTYGFNYGTVLNVLYIPLTPYIYKTSCPDHNYDNGAGTCISYNCQVPNCIQCHLTNVTCAVCDKGYVRNENLTCSIQSNITNSTNTSSNNTVPANATSSTTATGNATNSTVNSTNTTSMVNTTNVTNTSTNNTSNITNSANSTNTTSASNTINSTDTANTTYNTPNSTNITNPTYDNILQLSLFYTAFPVLDSLPWTQDFF